MVTHMPKTLAASLFDIAHEINQKAIEADNRIRNELRESFPVITDKVLVPLLLAEARSGKYTVKLFVTNYEKLDTLSSYNLLDEYVDYLRQPMHGFGAAIEHTGFVALVVSWDKSAVQPLTRNEEDGD